MEFIDVSSLLYFHRKLLLFSDSTSSHEHATQSQYIDDYNRHHNSISNKILQKDYHNEAEESTGGESSLAGFSNSSWSHYNLFSLSSMAAFSSGRGTPWDLVTEQADIIERSTDLSLTATQSELEEYPLRLPIWGIVTLAIGYLLVFIFGIVGNCCVVLVVVRLRRMKTVTNYFIFSLAIADLLVLFFCLLPNLVSSIFVPWVLGWFLCKTVPYIQGLSVCSSVYFLVAISVERCISIRWPFKHQITKEKAKLIIVAIWLWSCIVALPWALFFQSGPFDPDNPHLEFCIEVWPEGYETWNTYYFLFGNLFICFIFPLGVILICYLTIWFRVYRRSVPSNCYQQAMEFVHQRSKTAVIKMIFIVCILFGFSWAPLYAISIRMRFGKEPGETETFVISLVYPIAQWLGCFNSCVNPIIYSFLNVKFRKAFLSVIGIEEKRNKIKFKHKSPTVNILLKRFSSLQYRVETTMSNNNDSLDSI